jgi:hypothetical protein
LGVAGPPNNRLKLPAAVLGLVISFVLIAVGVVDGSWVIAVVGVLGLVVFPAQIAVIRRGRNPGWNRAPADYARRARGRRDG